jgi:septal ring factor EnvC (AmiA/AmiB activator)
MSKILLASAIIAASKKETTVEGFQSLIAQIVASVTDQETENAKTALTIVDLEQQIDDALKAKTEVEAKVIALQSDLDDANQTIRELGERLSLREENPDVSGLIVTVDKKDYQIIGNRFNYPNHGELTAKQLSEKPELLKEMIQKGSAAIVLLKKDSPSKSK